MQFQKKLRFRIHDVINTKEQTVISAIRIDLYFNEYKLSNEADKLGHNDRNINDEIQRQQALERELNCVFIRINPDAIDFNIFKEINKIHRHINQLTKQKTKESIIDNISKRLLEIEFVKSNLIKSKCLKWIVKNILPEYKL